MILFILGAMLGALIGVVVMALCQMAGRGDTELCEPMLDHWAVCPNCSYEWLLEIANDYAPNDNWMPNYCPNCGQAFVYGKEWRFEDGRFRDCHYIWEKAQHKPILEPPRCELSAEMAQDGSGTERCNP